MTTCTCQTEGCPNAGIPIDLELTYTDPDTGDTITTTNVTCGACGQPITDLDPPPPGQRERSADHDLSGKDDRG